MSPPAPVEQRHYRDHVLTLVEVPLADTAPGWSVMAQPAGGAAPVLAPDRSSARRPTPEAAFEEMRLRIDRALDETPDGPAAPGRHDAISAARRRA